MKLREIERLRAFAALLVLAVHWDPLKKLLPWILQDPWGGVDLFFVISGFVVTLSLVRLLPAVEDEGTFFSAFNLARQGLRTFYVRRFFRIMPAALAVALLVRVGASVFPGEFGSTRQWFDEFIAFFGGIYNYMFGFRGDLRLNVYWSLAVEEHFYLLLPVIFLMFRTTNRRLGACAGLALFSIIARGIPRPEGAQEIAFEMYSSHLRFDSLMAGVALALVRTVGAAPVMPKRLMRFVILPMVLVIIACLPGVAPRHVEQREGFIALWMFSGLLVSYAALDRGYVLSIPYVGRVFEYIGARSYSIYLLHQQVYRLEDAERKLWPRYAALTPDSPHPWQRVVTLLVATFIAAELLYRLVERPFIRLGRRLIESQGQGQPLMSPRGWRLIALAVVVWALFYARHSLLVALGPRNLARGKTVTLSTLPEDPLTGPWALVDGDLEAEHSAYTKEQDDPWMTIDLGEPTSVGSIRVYNRGDGYQNDNIPLELQVSNDGSSFETIARREVVFTQEWPWRIHCADLKARYVRLQVRKKVRMCLSEVEIFASQEMAAVP
ncbi:MAG TPA: acyltransferase family protein [Polyangiaceae bacterium]|jgi:peptidoglycan/LPS O-acetylase OafA/YrhL